MVVDEAGKLLATSAGEQLIPSNRFCSCLDVAISHLSLLQRFRKAIPT
jgi:hypothetical protein